MKEVSIVRLHVLRAVYLLISVGLALQIWPTMHRLPGMELNRGTVVCMLWALSVLSMIGLVRPLTMLPLIFFEMAWKSAWLLMVAWPRWAGGHMDYWTEQSAIACLMGVIFPFAVPWRYVAEQYLRAPADRWLRAPARAPAPTMA